MERELLNTSTVIRSSSETISGLADSMCGQIGVITVVFATGETTGPPALKLYPVEPVGVAMMTPSP